MSVGVKCPECASEPFVARSCPGWLLTLICECGWSVSGLEAEAEVRAQQQQRKEVENGEDATL